MLLINVGHVNAASDNSLKDVKDKGTLVLGTSPDYPPYEFQTTVNGNDKIVGFDISIARKIAKDIGVKLVIKKMDFDSLLVGLETHKIDMVISGMNPSDDRKKSIDFSDVYYNGKQMMLVNKADKDKYKKLNDFSGLSVGAQTGSLQYSMSKEQINNVDIKGLAKVTDLILALKSGKVAGVAMEEPTAKAYAQNDSSLAVVNPGFVSAADARGAAAGFAKKSDALVAAANKSIKEIKDKDLINKTYLPEASNYLTKNTADNTMIHYWKYFAKGIGYTLLITAISVVVGVILGTLLALMRLGKNKIIKVIAVSYIEFVRGTPLMIQVMFVYFGIGMIVNVPALLAGIIAVSLNSGAYIAEVIRSGIGSIDDGQMEAARSLGLSQKETYKSVIIPQALKNIWPALGNEFITLIKESSIVSIIGVTDLIYQMKMVQSATYKGIAPIFVAMVLYFVLTFSLSKLLNYFEGKMKHV
ncbi:ABC transporter substrate-binding protein/permease [Dellaglioa carnosa]|uniref:ABC transporter substrate-binding protein/permease n=1 Tax=Dellaglioa carnosa TaxID=2995136 RepID=A0ABT4JKC4_9LACO|nr:ABC transporter substrate-binding protein/permease [Dellaglioa carnosa]MCZ2490812.1 ABC transporter substrate-binding protein/permease [Dellaglioa carnosa]MCZ2493890.1 ABC transporter substrate-binding protein/permease [Dellaglioa carnosa]MDK1730754.1 ABC transporter substrate-binding protein/permease [Dellaglioa carnosa]